MSYSSVHHGLFLARLRACLLAMAVLVVLGSVPVVAAMAAGFVSGIDDLPLMDGLQEIQDGSMVFESAGGRVVEVYAVGTMSADKVNAFYDETLPQLGWRQVGSTAFRRGTETLTIRPMTPSNGSGELTVRFALSPTDK